jgi:hypothetical protein
MRHLIVLDTIPRVTLIDIHVFFFANVVAIAMWKNLRNKVSLFRNNFFSESDTASCYYRFWDYDNTFFFRFEGEGSNLFRGIAPTDYVMHQQFNIQQLYALPTLYLCVLYLSENKQRLVPLTP